MDRRTFLSHAVLGGAVSVAPGWHAAQAASTFPGILLIDGVSPGTPANGLFSFLDPIVSQNIPVGIAIRADRAEWDRRSPDPELMRLLSTLVADYPGLIDLALEIPELASLQPYPRMRAASEARNRLREAMVGAGGLDALPALPTTIVSVLPEGDPQILGGLRSAGILSAFLLPQDGAPPDIWRNDDGTQQVNGGWRLPPLPTGEDVARTISEATSSDGPLVLAAAFPDNSTLEPDALFDKGAILGDGVRRNLVSSRNYLILPSELRIRSGAVFSRHIVLCLQSEGADIGSGLLAQKLKTADLPFTEITPRPSAAKPAPDTDTGLQPPHRCDLVAGGEDGTWVEARRHAFGDILPETVRRLVSAGTCAAWDDRETTATLGDRHAGFEIVLDLIGDGTRISGFDEYGALRLNTTVTLNAALPGLTADGLRQHIDKTAKPNEDVVLLVRQDGHRTSEDADALVRALAGLAASGRFGVVNVNQYLEAVSVRSEPARLLRLAQRWPARQTADEPSAAERDLLIKDAMLAWSYVAQMTDPGTGLVPATVWLEDGAVQSYDFSTMWDTGSLILAIVSAHSIGLLTDADFSARIEGVLGGLATGVFNGLRLPKGLASTDGRAAGDDKYNASDTARLLVSLHVLQSYVRKDIGIRKVLDGWDLTQTIRNGVPLTAGGSRFVSAYRSNYAGYIARAFALWGYPVTSPYSDPAPGPAFDRNVHVLHEVADFGPIGAEPHLLECVELGASDLATAASEALFAAQVEEYLASGKLACVSEGPINREPWFIYHGYQIDEDGGTWTAETLDPSPRFKTRGFLRAVDMLNSKAAFLWSACRPGDYSDLLLEKVREEAKKSTLGFSPGVFFVTGSTDQAYSDINTNAVILEAVAYWLNSRKPASEWRLKI